MKESIMVELTREQINTIKTSLHYSIEKITNYPHPGNSPAEIYKCKRMSLHPVEEVLQALPDLRFKQFKR
jgi:hypothetical protein